MQVFSKTLNGGLVCWLKHYFINIGNITEKMCVFFLSIWNHLNLQKDLSNNFLKLSTTTIGGGCIQYLTGNILSNWKKKKKTYIIELCRTRWVGREWFFSFPCFFSFSFLYLIKQIRSKNGFLRKLFCVLAYSSHFVDRLSPMIQKIISLPKDHIDGNKVVFIGLYMWSLMTAHAYTTVSYNAAFLTYSLN